MDDVWCLGTMTLDYSDRPMRDEALGRLFFINFFDPVI